MFLKALVNHPSFDFMWEDVQEPLEQTQATPAVGPLFVSPAKLVVSSLQIAISVALGIIASVGLIISGIITPLVYCDEQKAFANPVSDFFGNHTVVSFAHTGLGIYSLLYSILNMATLGVAGYCIES